MFKQQNQPFPEHSPDHHQFPKKQIHPHRPTRFGIKLVAHSMQQNIPNTSNYPGIDHPKPHQHPTRNSSKGIQVLSSRQSSKDRRPLATSRSHERQKQSRQIKSQTSISEFQSQRGSKDASIQRRFNNNNSQTADLCHIYEDKFREAILKNNAVNELELAELQGVINSNEQRINNLIETLNIMIEKNDRKQKIIDKVEHRLQSLISYHEQCYEYTLNRIQNVQSVHQVLAEQIQVSHKSKYKIENRLSYIDLIIKDIFMIQRYSAKNQLNLACEQINKLHQHLSQIDGKIDHLHSKKREHISSQIKQTGLQEHLAEMSRILAEQHKANSINLEESQRYQNVSENSFYIQDQLTLLHNRVHQLQQQKKQLQRNYTLGEQKAKQTIWQLSALLHNHERQIQKKNAQLNQLSKYNIELQNKLIQSRLKENNLRTEMQIQYKGLQNSRNQQYDQVEKEKDVYKQRFEQLFRYNQNLQGVNCKNNLIIQEQQRQMNQLNQKVFNLNKLQQQNHFLKAQMNKLQGQSSNKLNHQSAKLTFQIQQTNKQNQQLRTMLNQNAYQIRRLQTQIASLNQTNTSIKMEHNKQNEELTSLRKQFISQKKQFEEEQLYSQHLENENQKLTNSLQQYKQVFQKQSQLFRNTIQTLKHQNVELQRTLDTQAEQLFANQPKRYQQPRLPPITLLSDSKSSQISKRDYSNNINSLRKIFQKSGWKQPVSCQIDGIGYLKHYELGTYIIDFQQNPFELNQQQMETAVASNIIKFIQ